MPRVTRPALPTPEILTVYGADWCTDCRRTRRYLDAAGIEYEWVDLAADAAAQRRLHEAGYRRIPVVITTSGQVLVEPSTEELAVVVGIAA
jgi:mycoredoxin